MSETDDRALVRECLNGNPDAFEGIVDRYQKVLFNISLRMVGDYDDASDVIQTVFIKAFQKLDSYNPKFKFFSWIYRIMINESLNLISRRKPKEPVGPDLVALGNNPDEDLEDRQLRSVVETALQELSEEYRRVIVLRHFVNLSYRDMSEAIGIPEKTVKSRLFSARRQLQAILSRQGVAIQ